MARHPKNHRRVFLSAVVLILALLAVGSAAQEYLDYPRSLASNTLRALGINDPLRYHLHYLAAEVALPLGLIDFASLQYRKAEPHGLSDAQRSSALAGYGEALAKNGSVCDAHEALVMAVDLDPDNKRANQLLRDLESQKHGLLCTPSTK